MKKKLLPLILSLHSKLNVGDTAWKMCYLSHSHNVLAHKVIILHSSWHSKKLICMSNFALLLCVCACFSFFSPYFFSQTLYKIILHSVMLLYCVCTQILLCVCFWVYCDKCVQIRMHWIHLALYFGLRCVLACARAFSWVIRFFFLLFFFFFLAAPYF